MRQAAEHTSASHRTGLPLIVVLLALVLESGSFAAFAAAPVIVTSPDGKVQLELLVREPARLSYPIAFQDSLVIETSAATAGRGPGIADWLFPFALVQSVMTIRPCAR
jgi:hypothetical protein